MRIHDKLTLTLTLATALGAAACIDDGAATDEAAGALTACGGAEVVADDGTVVEEERYDFAMLNARIAADPSLAEVTGVTRIETCDDARTFQQRLRDHVEIDVPAPDPFAIDASIKGGNPASSKRGVVSIERNNLHICTGFLLNHNVIVTAAHCLPGRSGTAAYTIVYFDPETGGERRITAVGERLAYRQLPDYGGSFDSEHDTGILVRTTTWSGTDASDYLRIYHDFGSRIGEIRAWGAGRDGFHGEGRGDLEWANFDIDWHENDYVITLGSRRQRMCIGDSGGPAIKIADGVDLVVATHSNMVTDNDSNGRCAREGGKQRHTRVYNKLSWIRQAAGAILGRTVSCSTGSAGGLDYDQCW